MSRITPDLIATTGDLADEYGRDLYESIIGYMDSLGIPWTTAMGNHDQEGDADTREIMRMLKSTKNCIFDEGPEELGYGQELGYDLIDYLILYMPLLLASAAVSTLASIAFSIFVSSPIKLGYQRFFLGVYDGDAQKAQIPTLFSFFNGTYYWKSVQLNLLRTLIGAIAAIRGAGAVTWGTVAFSLITGLALLQAAKDASKIMGAWLLVLVSLVLSAAEILFALNGSGDLVSSIIATVLNLIAFVAANNVKKQGK
jgi:hypothetical protein